MAQAGTATAGGGGFDWNSLTKLFARGEYALGLGVMMLVMMVIIPIPAFLLDFLLAISITLSVLILMTALLIQKPLEFSAFPTVLLLATLLRLALNIATTHYGTRVLRDGYRDVLTHEIRFASGHSVFAVTSNPAAFRGRGGG